MDKDGTGMINAESMSHYLKKRHLSMSSQEIKDIISELDYFGDQQIHYSEFLAATIDVKKFFTEQRLQAIFHQFDTDNDSIITDDDIVNAFQKIGHCIDKQEVKQIIEAHKVQSPTGLSS